MSFVVSGPSHSTIHSSRLARNPVSSRQFHYPRSLVDVCADVDLSLLLDDALAGLKLSLLGDICLCLSAFPLDLDLYADLGLLVDVLGETEVEARLKTLVRYDLLPFNVVSHSHTIGSSPCRSRTVAPTVLTLIMLPPNALLRTPAASRVRTALLRVETGVSAPGPTPSAMENAAPTRM